MSQVEGEWQPQPSRKLLAARVGVCACDVCAWRTTKLGAMLSGWDAFESGAVTICRWCRRRLGMNARELAQSGGGVWKSPVASDVWQDSLVRTRSSHRWARVLDFPPGVVRFRYEGASRRQRLGRSAFLARFEILTGRIRLRGT